MKVGLSTENRTLSNVLASYAAEHPMASAIARETMTVLIGALAVSEPRLLAEHARWATAVAESRADETDDVFDLLRRQLDALPDVAVRQSALEFVAAAALVSTGAAADAGLPAHRYAREFLELLVDRDSAGARSLVSYAAGREMMTLAQVYSLVFEPALIEAGRRWEAATMSIGREHALTEATLSLMDSLTEHAPRKPERERTFIAMCIEDESHLVGLRMITSELFVNGWKTIDLGANVPASECVAILRDEPRSVVGISVTMAAHLVRARDAIETIRAFDERVPIVVGGRPFRDGGDLWRKLGADAGPRNGDEAIETIERLADERFGAA